MESDDFPKYTRGVKYKVLKEKNKKKKEEEKQKKKVEICLLFCVAFIEHRALNPPEYPARPVEKACHI